MAEQTGKKKTAKKATRKTAKKATTRKATAKKAAGKKAAGKKATTKKPAARKAPAKKAASAKTSTHRAARKSEPGAAGKAGGRFRVTQVRSTIGAPARHRQWIKSLGLKRMNHTVEVQNTPAVRGLLQRANYLLRVEQID